jgi:23S rRNA (guanosine2251-2'-O)-methyltransferase
MNEKSAYIYGRNAIIESFRSGRSIEKIFVCFGSKGNSIETIFSLAKKNKTAIVNYDKRKFSVLEKKTAPKDANTQGVIALLTQIDFTTINDLVKNAFEKEENPVLVILDEINDPHNLGAIARSAECSGVSGMIITERNSAPISPAAIKASAGALEHISIAKTGSLPAALKDLKNYGFWIIGTDGNANDLYTDELYDKPVAIIIGSEGKGIRPSNKKHCDHLIRIPMNGKINSLNASVSAGIILFEIMRQKQISKS